MSVERSFDIPDDSSVIARLIKSVPSDWLFMNGILEASKEDLLNGRASADTGFMVERFHSIHPTIAGVYDRSRQRRRDADLFAIMVEQKLPRFVDFIEAGYDLFVTMELTKRLAAGFVQKGYRGSLRFIKDCHRDISYQNPARCNIEIGPERPFLAHLQWEQEYYGKAEDIRPMLDVCLELGLRERIPVEK